MFDVVRCTSSEDAFAVEAALLHRAAQSRHPELWARENKQQNPHYYADSRRREWLLAQARRSTAVHRVIA